MSRRALLALATACSVAAAIAFLLPATSSAADPVLKATVGPAFTISLTDSNGQKVTHLDVGTYTIEVSDLSPEHNFHLRGPGSVDRATQIEFEGTETWSVTLTDGIYHFQCDPHLNIMNGDFAVGSAQLPPPPPPPKKKVKPGTLTGVVGPGFTISLKKGAKRFAKAKAGRYNIKITDRAATHNFHLLGPGVNKKTGVKFKGKVTWKNVRFKKGKTYRFRCDPHRRVMKGRFKAV